MGFYFYLIPFKLHFMCEKKEALVNMFMIGWNFFEYFTSTKYYFHIHEHQQINFYWGQIEEDRKPSSNLWSKWKSSRSKTPKAKGFCYWSHNIFFLLQTKNCSNFKGKGTVQIWKTGKGWYYPISHQTQKDHILIVQTTCHIFHVF